jgi:hypothetical protein
MALPKIYDWERVRGALKLLAEKFPEQFPDWVLIGGGACWFYREVLKAARDPNFGVPSYTPEQEQVWLSKDLDFMGMTEQQAAELFQAPFKPETHTISYEGLEVDFLEEGLRLTLRDALDHVREVHAGEMTFYVLTPEILYTEKCALLASKDRPQDRLHHELLSQFLKYEFCTDLEKADSLDADDWVARVREVKTADLQFFANDGQFASRLARAIKELNPAAHQRIIHWAKHHLPGYPEAP